MSSRPARPPGQLSRSTTVTSRPRPAKCSAADNPDRPAPTTTTRLLAPGTVRISRTLRQATISFGSLRAHGGHVDQRGSYRFADPKLVQLFSRRRDPVAD